MSAPAGPCEWCGGPQSWTIVRGEMLVACKLGCLPLPFEELAPPPDGECADDGLRSIGTFLEGGGRRIYEGDEPDEPADPTNEDLPW